MSKLAPFILVALGSCATLDGYLERPVPTADPAAPVVTVGEATADTVDAVAPQVVAAASNVATALTGNPVFGGTAAALVALTLGALSKRLRKKKQVGGEAPVS